MPPSDWSTSTSSSSAPVSLNRSSSFGLAWFHGAAANTSKKKSGIPGVPWKKNNAPVAPSVPHDLTAYLPNDKKWAGGRSGVSTQQRSLQFFPPEMELLRYLDHAFTESTRVMSSSIGWREINSCWDRNSPQPTRNNAQVNGQCETPSRSAKTGVWQANARATGFRYAFSSFLGILSCRGCLGNLKPGGQQMCRTCMHAFYIFYAIDARTRPGARYDSSAAVHADTTS